MAEERRYRTNGGAAVDLYSTRGSAAVRLPQQLPHEQTAPKPQPKKRRRAKVEIAPFAVIGGLVVLFLLVMVLQAQVRLYEFKREQSALQSQLTELDQQFEQIRSDYEGKVNLRAIETEARALGMRKPTASQTVYLSISGADSAEVLHTEERGFFGTLWDAISDGFQGVVEYFG